MKVVFAKLFYLPCSRVVLSIAIFVLFSSGHHSSTMVHATPNNSNEVLPIQSTARRCAPNTRMNIMYPFIAHCNPYRMKLAFEGFFLIRNEAVIVFPLAAIFLQCIHSHRVSSLLLCFRKKKHAFVAIDIFRCLLVCWILDECRGRCG